MNGVLNGCPVAHNTHIELKHSLAKPLTKIGKK